MANRPSRLVVSAFLPSYDGRYHLRYPHGDKPETGALLEAHALARMAAAGNLSAAIRLAASGQAVAGMAGGISTAVRLAAAAIARSSSSAGLVTPEYWWDILPADYFVDPARVTNGAGTEASPFQPSQAFEHNPNGQLVIFEWLPGSLDFSDADATSKFSRWHPLHSGTATNPIIHRCRYKATRSTTTPAQLTSIRRIGGSGSILGVLNTTDCIFDGFNIPTWTGSTGEENFQYSVWGGRRVRLTRSIIDGQNAGVVSTAPGVSTNCGGVYHQDTYDCVVADCIIRNIGNAAGAALWSGCESYSADNLQIHNCDIYACHGFAIFEKGETTGDHINRGNRFYRNHIYNIRRRALFSYVHHTGLPLSDATWWFQNVVHDVQEQGFFINPIVHVPSEPEGVFVPWSGVVVVNNVFAYCGFDGLSWRTSEPTPPVSPEFAPLFVFRNNIFHGCVRNIAIDNGFWTSVANAAQFDYNRYANYGSHYNDSNGNRTFDSWDDLIGYLSQRNDEHGHNADAQFVDATVRNFHLQAGSPARNAATDFLALLGGLTSAPINQGAYIKADMSDAIGYRPAA